MALSDIYQKASLVQIPSGYKSGTLYSVVPNTADGDFTVTGDPEGEATRVNKDGLIESVAADVPRLNYDPTNPQDPHLLLEPSRTNNILQSNDPSGANWTDPLSRWTLLSDTTTAPDGGTVRIIELTESGGSLIRLTGFSIAAGTYTVSFYIKDIDGNLTGGNVDIGDEGSGAPSPAFGDVGSDWVRATRTITTTTTKTYIDLQPTFSGSTNKVAIWGVQLEAGSYPTSYIPTTIAVTRTKDTCINGGDDALFNDSEGVLFADLEALGEGTTVRKISLSNGGTDFVNFNFNATSGRVDFEFGSTSNSFYIVNSTGHTLTDRNKIAIKYKSGDTDCYINGTRVTGSNGTFTLSGLDRLNAEGRATNGTQSMFAKIHQLMVFNEALTDAELIALTS